MRDICTNRAVHHLCMRNYIRNVLHLEHRDVATSTEEANLMANSTHDMNAVIVQHSWYQES
jgi:hypothetical protein